MKILLKTNKNTYRYQDVTGINIQETNDQSGFTVAFRDKHVTPRFLSGVQSMTIQYEKDDDS